MTDEEALAEANLRWAGSGFVRKDYGTPAAKFLGGVSYEVGLVDGRQVCLGLGRGTSWGDAFASADRHDCLFERGNVPKVEIGL